MGPEAIYETIIFQFYSSNSRWLRRVNTSGISMFSCSTNSKWRIRIKYVNSVLEKTPKVPKFYLHFHIFVLCWSLFFAMFFSCICHPLTIWLHDVSLKWLALLLWILQLGVLLMAMTSVRIQRHIYINPKHAHFPWNHAASSVCDRMKRNWTYTFLLCLFSRLCTWGEKMKAR